MAFLAKTECIAWVLMQVGVYVIKECYRLINNSSRKNFFVQVNYKVRIKLMNKNDLLLLFYLISGFHKFN